MQLFFAPKAVGYFLIYTSAIAVIGYAGISNKVFVDQQRMNMRDRGMAIRILSRLEALPSFTTIKGLAIVGIRHGYPLRIETTGADMNVSAFGKEWSKLYLFREISGYKFREPTELELTRAREYCGKHSTWPAPGSVAQLDELGIVCI